MKKNKRLGRRISRLSTIAIATALAFSVWQSAEARALRFAYYPNPTHVYAEKAWTPFGKEIGERTGGELNVNMFIDPQLGSAGAYVSMQQRGVAADRKRHVWEKRGHVRVNRCGSLRDRKKKKRTK